MHNDGLVYFPIDGSRRGLLAQNNEYVDEGLLFPDGVANWSSESQRPQSRQRTATTAHSARRGEVLYFPSCFRNCRAICTSHF